MREKKKRPDILNPWLSGGIATMSDLIFDIRLCKEVPCSTSHQCGNSEGITSGLSGPRSFDKQKIQYYSPKGNPLDPPPEGRGFTGFFDKL